MTENTAPPRATDPRPARTREALYEAVRQLSTEIDTKPRSADPAAVETPPARAQISVNALVRRAGVSRSAFYAQFADLDDLMVALLIDTFREIGLDDLHARHDADHASARDLARASITRLGYHVAERRTFYAASLAWNKTVRAHQAVVTAYAEQVRQTVAVLDDLPDDVDIDTSATYIGGGVVAVLTQWVSAETPAPVPVLVDRILRLLPAWLTRDAPPTP